MKDGGSTQSYLTTKTASHLPPTEDYLNLALNILGEKKEPNIYPVHEVTLKDKYTGTKVNFDLVELQNILPNIKATKWKQGASQFPEYEDQLPVYQKDYIEVDIMIGQDQIHKLNVEKIATKGALVLKSTTLGPMLSGPVFGDHPKMMTTSLATHVEVTPPTPRDLVILNPENDYSEATIDKKIEMILQDMAREEQEASDNPDDIVQWFHDRIEVVDDKFQVPLLWYKNHPKINSNIALAKGWLMSTTRKLQASGMMKIYDLEIQRQLREGVIEYCGPLTAEHISENHHFLPHFPVMRPEHATTPLRIVFAANAGDPALNSCLNPGPSLIAELTDLLRKFRLHKFVATADIRKAFNAIQIKESDRGFLQFLWFRDGDPSKDLVVYRCKMVQFGPNCSPFLLFATLLYLLQQVDSEASRALIKEFYSDNLVTGKNSEEACFKHIRTAIEILATRNFNLRDGRSNSDLVNEKLQAMGKLNTAKIMSVLGLMWNSEEDTLSYKPVRPVEGPITKRACLKLSASLYDPLNLLLHCSVPNMAFIAKLWKEGYEWDEELSDDLTEEWKVLEARTIKASHTTIPRYVGFEKEKSVMLHIFTDASERAACAMAYLSQDQKTVLVGGKYRLFNETKTTLTTPKKELVGISVGTIVGEAILKSLEGFYPTVTTHIYSDSEICLHWIASTKKQETFVHNRLLKTRSRSKLWTWHHVGTDLRTLQTCPPGAQHQMNMTTLHSTGRGQAGSRQMSSQQCGT